MDQTDVEFDKLMMSEMGLELRVKEIKKYSMDVIKTALGMMDDQQQQHMIVTYDIDIEQSDYDSKMSVIRLGTKTKGDYRDYAIIAEEICHADQDVEGYWAMKMAKIGIFSSVFQYLVERDAKDRAKRLLCTTGKAKGIEYREYCKMCDYLDETLLEYRKSVFGI